MQPVDRLKKGEILTGINRVLKNKHRTVNQGVRRPFSTAC